MFDVCALWVVKYIEGEMNLPDKATMQANWQQWVKRNKALTNCHEEIDFQTDFVQELARDCGADYPYDLDVSEIFHTWEGHKDADVLSYRDKSFASKYTGQSGAILVRYGHHDISGVQSPIHHTTFMKALDDSMETFMHQKK